MKAVDPERAEFGLRRFRISGGEAGKRESNGK
jgi:hypothetical protein